MKSKSRHSLHRRRPKSALQQLHGQRALPVPMERRGRRYCHLISQFPDPATFVVWLNPNWGPIESDGKPFWQFKGYLEHRSLLAAVITIPAMQAATFGRDVEDLLKARLTFDEALAPPDRSLAIRQRLKLCRQALFEEISASSEQRPNPLGD